ncbi:TPA: KxYKxGKxW signal peptide domain-containing protein, partial [Streptococcus suis]
MNKKVNKNFTEISRNSRVKMHKSGKHWVRTVMSSIGLFRLSGGSASETVKVDGSMVTPKSNHVVRGLVAAGALLGAQVSAEQVLAEETAVVEKTVSATALSETVELSGTSSEAASESVSATETVVESVTVTEVTTESTTEAASATESTTESDTTSASVSTSESVSISESASVSESVSASASASTSESTSTSASVLLSEAASEAARVATSESAAVETPAATETATPAKVLEQVTSEAELLVDMGQKELAKDEEAALSTVVAASKTEIAAAKVVLANPSATLEQVEAQIVAVKAANEALAAELLKRDEDGVLTTMLADINASKVNDGSGTFNPGGVALIEPNPDMTDPHKAEAQSSTQGTMVATTTAGYLTFKYYPFSAWYDGTVGSGNGYGLSSSNGAYIRASVAEDLSGTVLLELLDKSNNILDTKTVKPGEKTEFTTFQDSAGGRPVVVEYDATTASNDSTGTLKVLYDENTLSPNVMVPGVVANTTTYKTEAGEVLGTYTIATIPGLTNIPSDVRDFPGFDYVRSEKTAVDVTPESAIPYVLRVRQGYPTSGLGKVGKYIAYKTIATPIPGTHSYTEAIYLADPNYTGTHDYRSTTTEGFIKVFESSVLSKGVTNTNNMLPASFLDTYTVTKLTTDPNDPKKQVESAPITDPAELDLNSLKANEWFKMDLKDYEDMVFLSRFQIGPATTGAVNRLSLHFGRDFNPNNVSQPGETIDPVTGEKVSGLDLTGITLPYTFSYAGVEMTETTHIYKKNEEKYNSLSDSLSESGSESASESEVASASESASVS